MTVRKQKIQVEVEMTTEGAVRANDKFTQSVDKSRKAVEKNDKALRQASTAYQVQQARAKNLTDRITAFGKAQERATAAASKMSGAASQQTGILAKVGKRLNVDVVGGLMAIGSAANIGRAAFDVISQGAQKVSELAERSVMVNNVMGNLPFSLDKARSATGGLVKDMDLARAASTLMSTGVVDNARDFAELSRAAQALGGRVGIGTPQAFESLTAALARGSTEMLDNLGIVLKQEEAHKVYADRLGKTVSALTDAEKAEAFREVAMQRIIDAARGIAVDTDSAGAAIQRFEADLDRLENRALGNAEAQVTLRKGLQQVALEFDDTSKEVAAYGESADELRGMLKDLNVSTAALFISNRDLGKELDKVRSEELSRIERLIFAGQATEENVKQLEELRSALGRVKTSGDAAVDAAIERQEEQELAARQARQAQEEELLTLRKSIAFLQGKGDEQELLNAAIQEEKELRATILETEGKSVEAARIRAGLELDIARAEGQALRVRRSRRGTRRGPTEEEKRTKRFIAASKRRLEEFEKVNTLMVGIAAKRAADIKEIEDRFDPFSEQNVERQLVKVIDLGERRAKIELDQRLRAIEEQRAAGVDPVMLAEQEAAAKIQAIRAVAAAQDAELERQIALAAIEQDAAEVTRLRAEQQMAAAEALNEVEAETHQAAMVRTEELAKAERAAFEKRQAIIQQSSGLWLSAAEAVARSVVMQGQSLKQAVASVAKAKALEHTILAVSEGIKAAIAFASFDFVRGAAHVSNAAQSAVFAAGMGAIAAAAGGGGGGGVSVPGAIGAESFGPGAAPTAAEGTGGTGGTADRQGDLGGEVPISGERSLDASGQAAAGTGQPGVVVNIENNISTLGDPNEETILAIEQATRKSGNRLGKLSA